MVCILFCGGTKKKGKQCSSGLLEMSWQKQHPWQQYPWQRHPWQQYPWQRHPWQQYPWQQHPWQTFPGQTSPTQTASDSQPPVSRVVHSRPVSSNLQTTSDSQLPVLVSRVVDSRPASSNSQTTIVKTQHIPFPSVHTRANGSTQGAKSLMTDSNQEGKGNEEPNQQPQQQCVEKTCVICMDNAVDIVFLPCGHIVSCLRCAQNMASCPICRTSINTCQKIYFS